MTFFQSLSFRSCQLAECVRACAVLYRHISTSDKRLTPCYAGWVNESFTSVLLTLSTWHKEVVFINVTCLGLQLRVLINWKVNIADKHTVLWAEYCHIVVRYRHIFWVILRIEAQWNMSQVKYFFKGQPVLKPVYNARCLTRWSTGTLRFLPIYEFFSGN